MSVSHSEVVLVVLHKGIDSKDIEVQHMHMAGRGLAYDCEQVQGRLMQCALTIDFSVCRCERSIWQMRLYPRPLSVVSSDLRYDTERCIHQCFLLCTSSLQGTTPSLSCRGPQEARHIYHVKSRMHGLRGQKRRHLDQGQS